MKGGVHRTIPTEPLAQGLARVSNEQRYLSPLWPFWEVVLLPAQSRGGQMGACMKMSWPPGQNNRPSDTEAWAGPTGT